MKQNIFVLTTSLALIATTLNAEPPAKTAHKRTSTKAQKSGAQSIASDALAESANGWVYVNGEWVHPEGYKFVNGKVLRTTAKPGKAFPTPPGKLALANPQKLTPKNNLAPKNSAADNTMSATERAAEARRKNLTPTAVSQTGTHL